MRKFCASFAVTLVLAGCLAALARPSLAQSLTATKDQRAIRIVGPAGPVAEYVYHPSSPKPYVAQWYTPAGLQVLRDSPGDHKHHHALMFALGVDNVDFWGETKGCGIQADRGVEGPRTDEVAGMPTAEFSQRLAWLGSDQKPLIFEQRTIAFVLGKNLPTRLLIWRSRLETAPGKTAVKLWGRDYFGLGVRFVTSMDQHARMVFPAGAKEENSKGHVLTRARWGACVGPVEGRTITLAMFDHPRNPRHPARFFTMTKPFAYVSDTLSLAEEPLELKAAGAVELCYGVALWDGQAEAPQIEALYQRWLALTDRQGAK